MKARSRASARQRGRARPGAPRAMAMARATSRLPLVCGVCAVAVQCHRPLPGARPSPCVPRTLPATCSGRGPVSHASALHFPSLHRGGHDRGQRVGVLSTQWSGPTGARECEALRRPDPHLTVPWAKGPLHQRPTSGPCASSKTGGSHSSRTTDLSGHDSHPPPPPPHGGGGV